MLTVHHLNNSRSHRLLVLLEELSLPYEIKVYRRARNGLAPESLRRVHPLGKAPILTDDDRVLVETGAIFEYVLDNHSDGRLRPTPSSDERLRFNRYMHYAEGSLMPLLLLSLIFSAAPRQAPAIARPLIRAVSKGAHANFMDPQLKLQLEYLESELAERPWFAGADFTAADIAMSFPLEALRARGRIGPYPRLADWIERFTARPSYDRAIARGGPQNFLI